MMKTFNIKNSLARQPITWSIFMELGKRV